MADRLLATRAPAKINLSLHLQGRRPDGYHELESLVAFASTGDTLSLAPGRELSLVIDGPTASVIDPGHDNLVLRAARHLSERFDRLRTGEFRLTKRLPVAAGIGGGSSDAAAALRLLARRNGLAIDHPSVLEAARATGADVPVCLEARARMMGGAGERLGPRLTLPRLFAVLVNPGVALETADVFAALGLRPGERLDAGIHPQTASGLMREELLARLALMRNDLEPQALKLEPVIGEALALLKQTSGCQLARMSGSGATVFGLFGDCDASAAAAKLLRRLRRHWWVKATVLR